jgi:tRNA threonylcarbamoyl adenosine modification protein YjeE
MNNELSRTDADEAACGRLAQRIALKLKPGDAIALHGDLGAGKTTFARALIRALLGDAEAEVPSPTFALMQLYDTPRFQLAHLDLYRLADESEVDELGIADLLDTGAIIVEWPERAPSVLPPNRLDITLSQGASANTRNISIAPSGSWVSRLHRLDEMTAFVGFAPKWAHAETRYLQGDASARAYARLHAAGGERAVLMDAPRLPDGPPIRDGLPYSRIAHLAEDVAPFIAVAGALSAAGLSVPQIHHADLDRGFLLLEDFGDRVFGRELENGTSQADLWRAATDALAVLHRGPSPKAIPLTNGTNYTVPPQDRGALAIEVELLPDWYWPALFGAPIPAEIRAEFTSLWNSIFDKLTALPAGWVLRDFHSPNLMWLPERQGARRVGIIDFQDALVGPPAYDLVSLLQDARLDVPADLEAVMFAHYCEAAMIDQPRFDHAAFRFAYSALGAQRNTKILGIFARLARRDAKPGYLRHVPRLWRYLERDLAHPELSSLRAWFDRHLGSEQRSRPIEA